MPSFLLPPRHPVPEGEWLTGSDLRLAPVPNGDQHAQPRVTQPWGLVPHIPYIPSLKLHGHSAQPVQGRRQARSAAFRRSGSSVLAVRYPDPLNAALQTSDTAVRRPRNPASQVGAGMYDLGAVAATLIHASRMPPGPRWHPGGLAWIILRKVRGVAGEPVHPRDEPAGVFEPPARLILQRQPHRPLSPTKEHRRNRFAHAFRAGTPEPPLPPRTAPVPEPRRPSSR